MCLERVKGYNINQGVSNIERVMDIEDSNTLT